MGKKENNFVDKILLNSWRPFVWLALLILLVYGSTLSFKLTNLDDNLLTVENIEFLKDFSNILKVFKIDAFNGQTIGQNLYRPILTITFIIDTQFSQNSYFFYHLTNIIVHLLATFFLFIFLQKLNHAKKAAFLFSLIFASHPLLTNVAVWLPGRNDSLLTLFILVSFIFLINFINQRKILSFLGHLLFFLLALFTKETAILLPVLYASYLILIYPAPNWCGIKKDKLFSSKYLWLGGGWVMAIIFWFFLRYAAVQNLAVNFGELITLTVLKLPAIFYYLGNAIFPVNLSTYPTLTTDSLIWGIISLVLILMLVKFSKKSRVNYLVFGSLWFFIFLLPTLALKTTPFFENRIYLPIVGLLIILLEVGALKNIKLDKRALIITCLALIFFSTISLTYAQNYRDSESFWQKAVLSSPQSAVAHSQLGNVYMLKNDLEKAKEQYLISLELNNNEPLFGPLIAGIHNNLGIIYAQAGNFPQAKIEYQHSLAANPNYADAYFNLGLVHLKEENLTEAVKLWEKTVELNPDYLKAHNNLTIYYYQQGDVEKTVYHLNQIQQRVEQLPLPLQEILNQFSSK